MAESGSYLFKEAWDVVDFIVDNEPCVIAHIMYSYFF